MTTHGEFARVSGCDNQMFSPNSNKDCEFCGSQRGRQQWCPDSDLWVNTSRGSKHICLLGNVSNGVKRIHLRSGGASSYGLDHIIFPKLLQI